MTEGFDADNTPFDRFEDEAAVRRLVDAFYDHMDAHPQFERIRQLHPPDLTQSRDKFFKFLCGWLGGPQYYMQEYGHPRLRMRHAPFPIGEVERDQWLACMADAMDEQRIEGQLRAFLDQRFAHVADFMRNQ
ncbi:MAG: group II truncated hemoglobin [Phycisphaerales bacterium]|nr:group II truncated hemoglobin [Phycisphaerales bacterium]